MICFRKRASSEIGIPFFEHLRYLRRFLRADSCDEIWDTELEVLSDTTSFPSALSSDTVGLSEHLGWSLILSSVGRTQSAAVAIGSFSGEMPLHSGAPVAVKIRVSSHAHEERSHRGASGAADDESLPSVTGVAETGGSPHSSEFCAETGIVSLSPTVVSMTGGPSHSATFCAETGVIPRLVTLCAEPSRPSHSAALGAETGEISHSTAFVGQAGFFGVCSLSFVTVAFGSAHLSDDLFSCLWL